MIDNETLNVFSLGKVCPLLQLLFNIILEDTAIAQGKKID